MNLEIAERNIRNAIKAGVVLATLSLVLTTIAMLVSAQEPHQALTYWNDPWNFLDPVLISSLLFGLHKRSRFASILLFLGFIAGQVFYMKETGIYTGALMGIVFLLFFGKAIQGTFFYHRFERANNPNYKRPNKLVWTLIGIPVCILSIAIGFVMLIALGLFPDSKALRSEEIGGRTMKILRANKLIAPNERVLFFYAGGFLSFLADGNLFTDRRVVSYATSEGLLDVYSANYEEIEDIQVKFTDSFFEDTQITVTPRKGDEFILVVSGEDGRDKEFVELLKSEWEKHKRDPRGIE